MDGSGPSDSQHHHYWEQLMPHHSGSSSTNQRYPWDPTPAQRNHAPSNPSDIPSPYDRAAQYRRRRDHYSPQNPTVSATLPSTSTSRECYNFTPPSLPEPRTHPDLSHPLPGIDSFAPDPTGTDFPASDLSWGSFGDDSLFDGNFWPQLESSHLDLDFNNNLDDNYFVDLTADAPPTPAMPPMTRKRRASATGPHAPSSTPPRMGKRPRVDCSGFKRENAEVEHLDLVNINDDGGLSKVLEQQQAAAIKEQQGPQGDVPTKLSNVQCIICMEPMTDMTVTHCGKSPFNATTKVISLNETPALAGHIFCHTCIMEALIAGENQGEPGKGTSKCPVCRKKVARPKEKSRDKREVIPLEIKFVTRSSLVKGKAKA